MTVNNERLNKEIEALSLDFQKDVNGLQEKYTKMFNELTLESTVIDNKYQNCLHQDFEDSTEETTIDKKVLLFNKLATLRQDKRVVNKKIDLFQEVNSKLKEFKYSVIAKQKWLCDCIYLPRPETKKGVVEYQAKRKAKNSK